MVLLLLLLLRLVRRWCQQLQPTNTTTCRTTYWVG
jgi:hypothetical protein